MIRGLLLEYGLVIPQGIRAVFVEVPKILEDAENGLDGRMRSLLQDMADHLKALDERVERLRLDDASRLLAHSAFCNGETALDIEGVLKQAVLKRGLPRNWQWTTVPPSGPLPSRGSAPAWTSA